MYFSNRAKIGKKYIEKIHQIATSTTGLNTCNNYCCCRRTYSKKTYYFTINCYKPYQRYQQLQQQQLTNSVAHLIIKQSIEAPESTETLSGVAATAIEQRMLCIIKQSRSIKQLQQSSQQVIIQQSIKTLKHQNRASRNSKQQRQIQININSATAHVLYIQQSVQSINNHPKQTTNNKRLLQEDK